MADHKPEIAELEKRASIDGGVADHDIVGNKDRSDADRYGHLSPEELVLEKKLRRKIDMVIMPTVILVYLMNYIGELDRAQRKGSGKGWHEKLTANVFSP